MNWRTPGARAVQVGLAKIEAARASFERALGISRAVFGPDHPEVAKALINLGIVQLELEEVEAARANFKHALAISEATYGIDHRKAINDLIDAVKALTDLDSIRRRKIARYLISASLALMRASARRNPEGEQFMSDHDHWLSSFFAHPRRPSSRSGLAFRPRRCARYYSPGL